jgi:hypothetical protein
LLEPAFFDPSVAGLRPWRVLAAFNREGPEMLEADLALACRFFEFFFGIELTPEGFGRKGPSQERGETDWGPAELEERIRRALATPGRPGVRKIAERFGVDPGTVQRVSRPFEAGAAAV